jgi:hypothetical protein
MRRRNISARALRKRARLALAQRDGNTVTRGSSSRATAQRKCVQSRRA